jgi:hypothetical protein
MGVKKSHKTWVVREVRHHDLAGLEAVIDASGLFPSTMLDSMIADQRQLELRVNDN